jgi:hypothetical protein
MTDVIIPPWKRELRQVVHELKALEDQTTDLRELRDDLIVRARVEELATREELATDTGLHPTRITRIIADRAVDAA